MREMSELKGINDMVSKRYFKPTASVYQQS